MRLTTKKIAEVGLLTTLALILSYVESLFPIVFGIPGIKLGLPNMLVLLSLYCFGAKEALCLNLLRILLSGFMFGNLFSILYSLAGAGVSFCIMMLAKQLRLFPMKSVSILGGVSHNVGQLLMACILVEGFSTLAYLPVLLVSGLFTGLFNGILAEQIYTRKKHITQF